MVENSEAQSDQSGLDPGSDVGTAAVGDTGQRRIWLLVMLLIAIVAIGWWTWPRRPPIINLVGHLKGVNDIAFRADGQLIATGSDDGTIRFWLDDGTPDKVISAHSDRATVVLFTPDGERLVSASGGGRIRVWDVETGIEILAMDGHEKSVPDLDLASDGRILASVGWDKKICIWDLATGKQLHVFQAPSVIECCVFTADGKQLITGGSEGSILRWDLSTGTSVKLPGHVRAVKSMTLCPDGDTLVTGSGDWTVRLWSLRDAAELQAFSCSDKVYGVALSPDGSQIVAGCKNGFLVTWDVVTRQQTASFRGDLKTVLKVATGPDGRLGAAGYPGLAFVWRAGEELPPEPPDTSDKASDDAQTSRTSELAQ